MQAKTMEEAVKAVTESKADAEVRVIRRMEAGSAVQQGDVYLHAVEADHPRGKRLGKDSVQIALGTGNGARHMVEGEVEVYEGTRLPETVKPPLNAEAREVTGPVVVAKKPFKLTHPEHAHFALPAGTYQTTYQYDPRTMRRVQD